MRTTVYGALLVSLALVQTLVAEIVTYRGEELQDLGRFSENAIDLTKDGSKAFLYVRLCPWTLMDGNETMISMTRYCYCKQSKQVDPDHETCSFPGPTLLMHSYTTVNVTLVNELVGAPYSCGPLTSVWNHYKDMDMTNLHVHGLHVSPFVDDIIFAKAAPTDLSPEAIIELSECDNSTPTYVNQTEWSYGYNTSYHYPGTFWYHAHHHGSTTWQVGMGLHGAILMNPWDDSRYPGNATNTFYGIGDYKQDVVTFQWTYAVPTDLCLYEDSNCDPHNTDTATNGSAYAPRFTDIADRLVPRPGPPDDYSMCDVWCQMPSDQRLLSGYYYDVVVNEETTNCNISWSSISGPMLDEDCMFFFVNGQYEPTIEDVTVNEYRRLRMINSNANWYLQMKFPAEHCQWHLIATDGVYTDNTSTSNNLNYPLNSTSHGNELIMSPGGRVDVLYRCTETGTFNITSSRNTSFDPSQLENMSPKVYGGRHLFSINVVESSSGSSSENETYSLPKSTDYPPKPAKTYIQAFGGQIQKNCSQRDADDCHFSLYMDTSHKMTINGHPFELGAGDNTFRSLVEEYYLGLMAADENNENDKGVEFIINNGVLSHVYHQHINPFNVPYGVGSDNNTFIALPNTWWDTMGNNGSVSITAKMWTRGDWYYPYDDTPVHRAARNFFGKGGGLIIVHCHMLQHEDIGMMGFYGIVSSNLDDEGIEVGDTETDNTAIYVFLGITVPLVVCALIVVAILCFRKRRSSTKDEDVVSETIQARDGVTSVPSGTMDSAIAGSTEMTRTAE